MMYLLTVVDELNFTVWALGILLMIPAIVTTIMYYANILEATADNYYYRTRLKDHKIYRKLSRTFTAVAVTLIALGIALPSSKAIAFIYIAPQIIENGDVKDTVKNIPELTKLGTEYLKQLLEEKTNSK